MYQIVLITWSDFGEKSICLYFAFGKCFNLGNNVLQPNSSSTSTICLGLHDRYVQKIVNVGKELEDKTAVQVTQSSSY